MDEKARIIRTASQDPNNWKFGQQLALLYHSAFGRLLWDQRGLRHLILSPDSTMSLIPLATAVSHKQRFLIEDYVLTYVSSGRDLLRFGEDRPPARSGPVVLANPDYDAPGEPGKTIAAPVAKGALPKLSRLRFTPLPGTAEEAAAIRKILPQPVVELRAEASESAMLRLAGPKILHVATHGFFLSEDGSPQKGKKRGFELDTASDKPVDDGRRVRVVNPMFRSAIALAGANVRKGQDDDGILTAYEVSALDLSGTELVVLSACETGLGSLVAREGVQGLRRALVVAGAETQVMSLWQVDDNATRDLMVSYYDKLFHKGMGRGEAMREAQVEMLHTKGREHPFYWASFIVSGAWGPLTGLEPGAGESKKPALAGKAVVPPGGARGCGCVAAGQGPKERAAAALFVVFALLLTRRSRGARSIC
jgi:MYXO-CTERM domain-containing protein